MNKYTIKSIACQLSHRKGQYHTFSEPCPVKEELLNHIKILNKWFIDIIRRK